MLLPGSFLILRVVGLLRKLAGSLSDTFNDSNHEDAMTRSPLSAPSARCCCFFSSTYHLVTTALFILLALQTCNGAYYGKLIGKLSQLHHGVSGEVYAVDGRTLHIKDFTYDGEGPAAYFYVGTSKSPNGNGFRVRDERGTTDVLRKYRKRDVTLTLPEGKTLNNIKWFSVYCDEFAVNFGDVRIPRGFDYPRPQKLAALNGVHGVSSEPIVVVDAQTLLIPGFSYDGEAPDAKFWVGSGPHPSPQGIRVPDENGKLHPLRLYQRKTIVLTLPDDLTVHQLGHFGVWCEAFTVDFGHVQIPSGLNVPPSLKMLGVSPQSKLNCEVLEDSLAFEVRWAVAGDSIVVQLVGKLDGRQYMSFGLSSNPERSVMVGGDVVVAWVDKQTLQGYAVDYFLDAKSQCSGGRGSCPDTRIQDNTNSVRLLNAAMVNGYSIVTYQRPLKASDELDRQIRTNGSQAIIWAIGPLNERNEVSFHSHYLKTDKFIEFGRPPVWNCPMPDGDHNNENAGKESNKQELAVTTRRPQRLPATPSPAATKDAWTIPPIQCNEPEDGVLFAQMGPTGGKHGYPAITGHVGWGISWYINGLLIPEIYVVRGKKYSFVVEAGTDAEVPARYHPFYITDDPIGGYQHKTPEEKAKVKIFAGVRRQRGALVPTGTGRLCNWQPDPNYSADDFSSFGAYQRTLTLTCDPGEPGIVEWTPDANTPDTVYYQCFTHRYLGWKINVVDSCDLPQSAASETHEVYAAPPQVHENPESDMESGASIRVTSKVTPAPEFYSHHHNHHHPHQRHPQQDQMMHYQLHQNHHYNPHYMPLPPNNKNHAINPNLITAAKAHNNNNKNVQLTATRGGNTVVGGVGVGYEQRDPYELTMHSQSYEEQAQSLPMRPPLYQSTKPMQLMQQNHHHHHHHMLHHLSPYHAHGGIRSQGHTDGFSLVRPAHPRAPLVNHASAAAAYYRENQPERGESSLAWPAHNVLAGSPANADSVNVVGHQQTAPELDQEVHQSVPVPASAIASSSNQPSNLVPDQRPIMSYGQMKYPAYPHPGSAQYLYSRPTHNPHKTGQLMIIRRPIIHMGQQQQQQTQRRPILGSMIMSGGQDTHPQPRPVFMERKKATYQAQNHKNIAGSKNAAIYQTKLMKLENNKQQAKIEEKMSTESETISVDRSPGRNSVIKPARNTGFDPDSIVIESGFKPIIRNIERETSVGRSQSFGQDRDLEGYQMDEATNGDNEDQEKRVGQENFEPMFVPSPPDRNSAKKQQKKKNQRTATVVTKTRLDDLDDMEMAADRLDSYYLPPSGVSVSAKRIEDRIGGAGTLIAFDGKRVKDSSLARSIPRVEEKRPRSRVSSDVLSRTPQFGKFRGELPPPIPGDVRPENLPQLELHGGNFRDHDVPQSTRGITKLTPLDRVRRSPLNRDVPTKFEGIERIQPTTIHAHEGHDHSMHDHSMHDHSKHSSFTEYDHANHAGHNHTGHDHKDEPEKSTLASTGQMVINEMPYVLLTIVLYFAI